MERAIDGSTVPLLDSMTAEHWYAAGMAALAVAASVSALVVLIRRGQTSGPSPSGAVLVGLSAVWWAATIFAFLSVATVITPVAGGVALGIAARLIRRDRSETLAVLLLLALPMFVGTSAASWASGGPNALDGVAFASIGALAVSAPACAGYGLVSAVVALLAALTSRARGRGFPVEAPR